MFNQIVYYFLTGLGLFIMIPPLLAFVVGFLGLALVCGPFIFVGLVIFILSDFYSPKVFLDSRRN